MPALYMAAQVSPPADLRSVYLTAGGALFGVLLTVALQAINSRIQRRHESEAKLFDKRLEIYSKILNLSTRLAALNSRMKNSSEAMQRFIEFMETATPELDTLTDKYNLAIGQLKRLKLEQNPCPESVKTKETEVKELDDQIEALNVRMQEKFSEVTSTKGLESNDPETVRELGDFISENMATIRVISRRSTDQVLQTFWSAFGQQRNLTPSELRQVRFVIRRELGIGRPYLERIADWLIQLQTRTRESATCNRAKTSR